MSNNDKSIVLVTGGAGLVGSHLAEELAKSPSNRVISLDNYSNGSSDNHVQGVEYRKGHTKDIDRLVPETPNIIYHLGEYARIATSFQDIAQVIDFNIVGTFHVLEFCRSRGVKKLVYAGSSTKFATEGDGRSQSPYAYSKASNVDLVNNYGKWYGLNYAITYFYNVYGPREKGDGEYATVIAKFKNQYLRGEKLTVVMPGTQERGFTHVADTVRGIISVGEHGKGDGYQLGTGKNYSLLKVARMFGCEPELIMGNPGRQSSALDLTKAEELGWKPVVDLESHIREFVMQNPRVG